MTCVAASSRPWLSFPYGTPPAPASRTPDAPDGPMLSEVRYWKQGPWKSTPDSYGFGAGTTSAGGSHGSGRGPGSPTRTTPVAATSNRESPRRLACRHAWSTTSSSTPVPVASERSRSGYEAVHLRREIRSRSSDHVLPTPSITLIDIL